MPELLEAALRYAELGYPVFPLSPGTKIPLANSHGHKDATTVADTIRGWWSEHPDANIGIATSGLLVLDVDNGSEWLHDDVDKLCDIDGAPLSHTPRGGRHYVFRQPDGKQWTNTAGKVAPSVDTRGYGGYIVAPPSVVRGGVYKWVRGSYLDEPPVLLPEPPAWLIDLIDGDKDSEQADGDKDSEQAFSDWIATLDAFPEGTRNDNLFKMGSYVQRLNPGRDAINAFLQAVNQAKCHPSLRAREVETIATSCAKLSHEQSLEMFYGNTPLPSVLVPDTEEEHEHEDPGPIPETLLSMPGFVNQVRDYTLSIAPVQNLATSFNAALALQSTLIGRKVESANGTKPNIYLLSLAGSGTGKDRPIKVNQAILDSVDLSDCLAGSIGSGQGVEQFMASHSVGFFQTDEIDSVITDIAQNPESYAKSIATAFLNFFSASDGIYTTRVLAREQAVNIHQPYLVLYGSAVPEHFYNSVNRKMLTSGFLSRMLIIEADTPGKEQDKQRIDLPSGIVDVAAYWSKYSPPKSNQMFGKLNLLAVPDSPDAKEVFATIKAIKQEYFHEAVSQGDTVARTFWTRSVEKAERLAIIYACSENHRNPVITPEAYTWAWALVEHATRRMLYMCSRFVHDDNFDGKCQQVTSTLQDWKAEHGDDYMPSWKLSRKHRWPKKVREDVLETLVETKIIEKGRIKSARGYAGDCYRIINYKQKNETEG